MGNGVGTAPWNDVPEWRRRVMQANQSKDTRPELALRSLVHSMGYRFRLHRRDLPGTPDMAFPGRKRSSSRMGAFGTATRVADAPACRGREVITGAGS